MVKKENKSLSDETFVGVGDDISSIDDAAAKDVSNAKDPESVGGGDGIEITFGERSFISEM